MMEIPRRRVPCSLLTEEENNRTDWDKPKGGAHLQADDINNRVPLGPEV